MVNLPLPLFHVCLGAIAIISVTLKWGWRRKAEEHNVAYFYHL